MRANPIRDLASCASCYHLFNALSAPKSVKDVLRLNNALLRQMWDTTCKREEKTS